MLDHLRTMARYNAWANSRLYEACSTLPEGAYMAERPSFFGSIHNTLNHILVVDRLWMGRIETVDPGVNALDQILHQTFFDLLRARALEDRRIVAHVDGLDDGRLHDSVAYRTMAGEDQEMPVRAILAHLFNHATHHRGQVHDMLSQVPVDPPPLDLMIYLYEQG